MCIVVVDDARDIRDLVGAVLEDEGYRVVTFAHPVPVTALTDGDEHPDLFLIDIMLPEMNGIALAARLRDDGFDGTPKIAMSASRLMIDTARESGLFDATLDKPFDVNDLVHCIEVHTAPSPERRH